MTTQKRQPCFFLAGAFIDDIDETADFIQSGRWESGWQKGHEQFPGVQKKMKKMLIGDRIAIKKKLGQGSNQIMIRAIGIIKSINVDKSIVYVDWVVTGMKRKVDSSNAFATLHGPYLNTGKHADWINQIFCLWCNDIEKRWIISAFILHKKTPPQSAGSISGNDNEIQWKENHISIFFPY